MIRVRLVTRYQAIVRHRNKMNDQDTSSYTSSGDSVSQTKLNGQDMSSYTSFDKCLSHKHTDPRLP